MSHIKDSVVRAHNAISANAVSVEIDTKGFNAIIIQTIVTIAVKNWTTKILGSAISGGTFSDLYDNTTFEESFSFQTNTSKIMLFRGLPQFIKIDMTEDEDGGKATVYYQLINV